MSSLPPAGETNESALFKSNITMDSEEIKAREDRRIHMLIEMYDIASRCRQSHEPRWQRNYEFYYGCDQDYKKKQAHQSKIVVPVSYQLIETSTPQFVMSVMSQDPVYSVNAQSTDDPYKARVAEGLLNWQLKQMKNVMLEHTLWIKDSRLYGTSICKTGWDYRVETRPTVINLPSTVDFVTGTIIQERRLTYDRIVTADQPCMKNVDIGEIYPDPTATCLEDAKYIIHRQMVPMVELKKMGMLGIYKNVDKIGRTSAVSHWASQFAQRRFSTNNFEDPFHFREPIFDYVEVLECWYIDPTDPFLTRYKTVIANRQYILQDIPLGQVYWHNRWPFVMLKNTPMTNEFWSISEIDATFHLQKELNSLRNQRMDNLNATLKAYWLVARSAGINKEKLKRLAPGDMLMTNDINGVKIERPPEMGQATFNSELSTYADIQRTTGQNDMLTGTPTRSQVRNATTASLLDQNSKNRWGLGVLLTIEQMRRIGQDFLALNQQFMTTTQVIEIMGEDGVPYKVPVDASMIPRNPDVFVTLGMELQGNKDLKRELILKLDPIMASTPNVNISLWRKDMLKEYGFKNPERYFEGEYTTPTEVFLSSMGVKNPEQMQQSDYLKLSTMNPGTEPRENMPGGSVMPMQDTAGDAMEGVYGRY